MPNPLSKDLRNQLARVTQDARDAAESAVRAAIENLAVHEKSHRPHMDAPAQSLRKRLQAQGSALGDARNDQAGTRSIEHLVEAAAYEHWHRLLFTRFLADNELLHTDAANGSVPVTLAECEELAPEMDSKDGFALACRFASQILPGVFRRDDPVLELRLAPNDDVALRKLVHSLPSEVFQADDALGWTYQFWQAKQKNAVNASGVKIGADELPAVTQLFTEDYMVEFLLHNTVGAWWAGKRGPIEAASEDETRGLVGLPEKSGLPAVNWTYLRLVQDEATKQWSPAAGAFDGWPKTAAEIRFLDPCMGSGHFPVFALPILARLRLEEEELSAKDAVAATLRDNIFGLELDPRCTQIGAFNLALTAWKLAGYQALPQLNVACSGLAPNAPEKEWVALAGRDDRLRRGMARLHALFKYAPVLGSLINPSATAGDLIDADFQELQPLLERALAQETMGDLAHEMAVTARGLAKAAEILAGQFTLIATNVPYLGRGNQDDVLMKYCERVHPEAKTDLASCFIERSLAFCSLGGSTALVTPQSWLFQPTYTVLRRRLLSETQLCAIAKLGTRAFETIGGEVVNVSLVSISERRPTAGHTFAGLDCAAQTTPPTKANALAENPVTLLRQSEQVANPDARIGFDVTSPGCVLLSSHANTAEGLSTGDGDRYIHFHWEALFPNTAWEPLQEGPVQNSLYGGLTKVVRWENGEGTLASSEQARIQGQIGWGHSGVLVSEMKGLGRCLHVGFKHYKTAGVIVPHSIDHLAATWAYCESDIYAEAVRGIDQGLKVAPRSLAKVAFDLPYWQKVAAEKYPHGLPKPFSNDPTQWLFSGHPAGADQPLHVAVARLLGFQWPRQTGSSFLDCPALELDGLESLADEDGIVCLPPINKEQPAAVRLRSLLAAALGSFDERTLIAQTGSTANSLEEWLRDEFFEQHSKLFHHRPFIWHLWDGRPDGFHVLVNYHKLDHEALKKLTYSYLGDWIRQQEQDAKADTPGAADLLGAAQFLQAELVKILEGEAPYDIFARWKPLSEQAIGWHPDINDGVRMNIRPFIQAADVRKKGAGLLRFKPNIKWDKDRGSEPERPKAEYPWFWSAEPPPVDYAGGRTFEGNRWNDVHFTLEAKRAARAKGPSR